MFCVYVDDTEEYEKWKGGGAFRPMVFSLGIAGKRTDIYLLSDRSQTRTLL